MRPTSGPRGLTTQRPLLACLALVALLGASVGCSTNPATGQSQLALISQQQEIEMGRQAHQQVLQSMGAYDDPELQRYVDAIGRRLASESERPDLPWTFTVLDDPSVNAFAIPGGFIYLTRGILTHMSSEAEMVSVLGHEIGHVTARHSVERMSKAQLAQIGLFAGMILSPEVREYGNLASTGLQVMFLKFSRDDERQADDLGLRYTNGAGYEPREMAEMFRTLDRVSASAGQGRLPNWLATHPAPADRVERIQRAIAAAPPETLGHTVDRNEFMTRIDGVEYGQDPREGYSLGNTFYHPDLAFTLQFPPGWTINNQKQAVGAISPQEDAVVVLTLAQGQSAEDAARQFFNQQGVQQGDARRASLAGQPAVTSTFSVPRQQGGDLAGLAAFVEHQGQVFQILGYTLQNRARSYRGALEGSVASFGRLTDRRYLDVSPKRVDMVTLDRNMTIEEFARRYPSTVDTATLAILNHADPGETLEAGKEYKRIVGGELPR